MESEGGAERHAGLETEGRRPERGGDAAAGEPAGGTVEAIVRRLRSDEAWRDRLPHWHAVAPRAARWADFPPELNADLVAVLRRRGIGRLYAHQRRAVELALAGRDVLVATPTASGKTLCYTIPILQSLLETGGRAKALCLFPTKALSQDQTVGLTSLVEALGRPWCCFTYDGDTPPPVRRRLRTRGHVVLTNPWMLHQGILPNHGKWADLFQDLRWIVVDEVHTLCGVFGSSVANVFRRLLRIARHYGAEPRFLASSATLREAGAHARRLFGREVEVVDRDGSPAGRRWFAVYVPPVVNPSAGLRAPAVEEAARLARAVCGRGHQTIFFCRRRTAVEVLTRYLKEGAPDFGLSPDEVRGYRGGYLPELRREIERGLREGSVKVVVATHALELGIDVGALDVAVLVGYPGSQASFWQRAGRVGRRGEPALVVQIARSDPLDQYLARHPELLFRGAGERLALDPDNPVILSEQLKCAAFELPFRRARDGSLAGEPEFGASPRTPAILETFAAESGFLHERGGVLYWTADAFPARDVTLKGNEPDNVVVIDLESGSAIGEIDREGSITTVHEGAIYQVEGATWKIERFDYENRRAYARKVVSDYYTDAHTETEIRWLRDEAFVERRGGGGLAFEVGLGEVHVTTLATLYKKVRFRTHENLGAGDIDLPPEELDSECFLLALSEEAAAALELRSGDKGAAWFALGRLLKRVAPLHLRCQPSDLGLAARIQDPHRRRPCLYLWDRVMGGVGLARLLFEEHERLLAAAREVVTRCPCPAGCPACTGPLERESPAGKLTARAVLAFLSGELAPPREDGGAPAGPAAG